MTWLIALPIFSRSDIWINGTVYTDVDSVQQVVPFAMVTLYTDSTQEHLAYFTVCGTQGNYVIKPYDHTKSYYLKVEAPGYAPREVNISPIPEVWDGKPFSGNATTHICLKASAGPQQQYEEMRLTKAQFSKGCKNLKDLLLTIPSIHFESGEWFTNDGRGILFCINGDVTTIEKDVLLKKIPVKYVDSLTIYSTDASFPYGLVVDIALVQGDQAQKPKYHMAESQFFYE
jgi:hypothetical protein